MAKKKNIEKTIPFPDSNSQNEERHADSKRRLEGIAIGVIGTLVVGAAALLWFNAAKLPVRMDNLEKRADITDNRIEAVESNLNSKMDEMKEDLQDDISGIQNDINRLENLILPFLELRPSAETAQQISYTYGGIDEINRDGKLSFLSTSIVAYSGHGAEFTTEQLADLKLLLPYREGNQEVFFYGQFDENDCWDGDCLVNIYEDGKLALITDAVYENGKLLTFKQAFPDTTTGGQKVWTFSERTSEDDFSTGQTWHYFWDGDRKRAFLFDDVTAEDMISADAFLAGLEGGLEGYYCGVNSEGHFNDDTGNAYMVKYFADGTVRTLYSGKFVDGQFDDTSGNAWMIGKLDMGKPYSYYKGNFKDGNATEGGQHWIYDLPEEDVAAFLSEIGFQCGCDLVWRLPTI
ncbi:hypothetical protein [uncultured Dysosmobacter sp.]|uniref:hypothetical protein n=1 Tax=uncultured Dysosmobacter sp. TaxID=2591384 RepID=UPI00261EC5C4|nr:hypothetical protein [uncultured Dysosmobacter sp.]